MANPVLRQRRQSSSVSRKRNSLNERFPKLNAIGNFVKADAALIDGEVVALAEDGLPQFDALRSRGRKCAIVFYAFDLLHLNGLISAIVH
jgi:bifunctional non-homologous end joining protein LigD